MSRFLSQKIKRHTVSRRCSISFHRNFLSSSSPSEYVQLFGHSLYFSFGILAFSRDIGTPNIYDGSQVRISRLIWYLEIELDNVNDKSIHQRHTVNLLLHQTHYSHRKKVLLFFMPMNPNMPVDDVETRLDLWPLDSMRFTPFTAYH